MNKKATTLLLFFLTSFLLAQNLHNTDSLLNLAAAEKNDTIKAKHLNVAVKFFAWDNNLTEALKLIQQIKPICKTSKIQLGFLGFNYGLLSKMYSEKNSVALADQLLDTSITYRELSRNKKGLFESINAKGILKWKMADYNSALALYLRALKIGEELKDTALYLKVYNNIGIVYYSLKRFAMAIDYYKKVINYIDSLKDPGLLSRTLDNVGIAYLELKEIDTGLSYNLRSLKIKEALKDDKMISVSYLNIGNVYHSKKDYRSALAGGGSKCRSLLYKDMLKIVRLKTIF